MSCALFVALIGQPVSDSAYRFVLPLSRASFGIYLAHVIVMAQFFAVPPFSLLPQIGSNIYMIPLLGLLGFILTFVLIFILQKIPILKKIVP
jgi:surface polysaccharide O-acyltransferase-like enzyme